MYQWNYSQQQLLLAFFFLLLLLLCHPTRSLSQVVFTEIPGRIFLLPLTVDTLTKWWREGGEGNAQQRLRDPKLHVCTAWDPAGIIASSSPPPHLFKSGSWHTQPPTPVCAMEAQSTYVHIACTFLHVWCRFVCSVGAYLIKFCIGAQSEVY